MIERRRHFILAAGLVSLSLASCGFGRGEVSPTTPTLPDSSTEVSSGGTTTSPGSTSSLVRFELSSEDGAIAYSAALASVGANASFEIMFKPLDINRGNSGFSNVMEFWLDKGPEQNGVALGFGWMPDSRWRPYFFQENRGFVDFRPRQLIDVGGRFRTVRVERSSGTTEWFLDGTSLAVVTDAPASRTVFVRVVGTRAEFRYDQASTTANKTLEANAPSELTHCGSCLSQALLEK